MSIRTLQNVRIVPAEDSTAQLGRGLGNLRLGQPCGAALKQVSSFANSKGFFEVRPLTIAVGNPGLTKSLRDGSTPCSRLRLNFIQVDPIIAAMRRMVRNLEFDICEMALSTYLCARSFGKPFTAIPVFPARNFHHRAMFYNLNSGIAGPKDLEGRTVGVHRGYTVTTGLWARGILQTDYGVDLKRITWAATGDEHVEEYQAPPNVNYSYKGKATAELLVSGEIGAAVGDIRVDSADVKSLIPDARNAGVAYFRKTGIYPVNHCLVIRNEILSAEPWVAEELFNAFKAAKNNYLARLDQCADLSPADEAAIGLGRAVGGDPFPFGVHANRKALEAIVQFAYDQQVIPKKPGLEELFAPSTLTLE
jgi:4,5-dihydroxyphthalate decarboxylase